MPKVPQKGSGSAKPATGYVERAQHISSRKLAVETEEGAEAEAEL